MTTRPVRIVTRASPLARAQTELVVDRLRRRFPDRRFVVIPVVAEGDRPGSTTGGGKGRFTRSLERAIAEGQAELAVHSLKDLPTQLDPSLVLAAVPERGDPGDRLVAARGQDLDGLPPGATVLTGAPRRRAFLLHRRPDLKVEPIRGNVDTRLARLAERPDAALVVAAAALDRLSTAVRGVAIDPTVLPPAPGQGALAVEARRDGASSELAASIDDPAARSAAEAERSIVGALGADCTTPLGVWARLDEGRWRIDAAVAAPDGSAVARGRGFDVDPGRAARRCLEELRSEGVDDLLSAIGR